MPHSPEWYPRNRLTWQIRTKAAASAGGVFRRVLMQMRWPGGPTMIVDMPDDPGIAAMRAHYDRGLEFERLDDRAGQLEFKRTKEIVLRHLPPPPAVVARLGREPDASADNDSTPPLVELPQVDSWIHGTLGAPSSSKVTRL